MRLSVSLLVLVGCRPMVGEPRVPDPVPTPVPTIDDVVFHPPLARNSPLDRVALAAATSASAGYVVSARAVRDAMATQLGSGMWPYVLTGWGSEDEIAAQLEAGLAELRTTLDIAEIGVARASGRAGHVGIVIATPFPKLPLTVERGDPPKITMAWPWADAPAAFAVTPTRSQRLEPTLVASNLDLAIDCTKPAAIEIRAGTRVVATVVDACDGQVVVDAGSAIDFGPPAHTRVEIEDRVFELVNRERTAHGRPALAWDPQAHRFARRHAEDMARGGYVGHEAPDGASLHRRVEAAPFHASASRENVGHAWGPAEVHVAFVNSPGHRANLLGSDIDRGAIGIAVDPADPNAFYIAEFFRTP